MGVKDHKLLHFVQDYQIHLIDPAKLTEADLGKFSTSLREVIGYIKYSKDKDRLAKILKDNPRMIIDREAALVIKAITNTPIDIQEETEEIDMCEAVEAMLNESEARGIERGIEKGREEGREGLLMLISRMSAGGDSDKVVQLNDSAVLEAMLKKYGIE